MVFKCEECLQEFETNGSLLKHISHREICLLHYGSDRFDQMKFESKLASKRKWKQAQSDKHKIEYEKNRYDTKNANKRKKSEENPYRYSYVPVAVRNTFEGKSFIELFKFLFEMKRSEMLEKFSKSLKDKFNDETIDKALDIALTDCDQYEQTFLVQNPEYALYYDSYTIEVLEQMVSDNLEKALEDVYNTNFAKIMDEKVSKWVDFLRIQVTKNCYTQGEKYSLRNFLGKYEVSTFLQILDEALDNVFDHGLDELSDDKIEKTRFSDHWDATFDQKIEFFLDEKLSVSLGKLVLNSYDPEMAKAIEKKIETLISDQIEYTEYKIEQKQ